MAIHVVSGDDSDAVVRATIDEVFFVIQQKDGAEWSAAARIIEVYPTENMAEASASAWKEQHPYWKLCVAVLRSEAMHVAKPVEIVRTTTERAAQT